MEENKMSINRNIPWIAVIFAFLALAILTGIIVSGFGLRTIPKCYLNVPEIALPVLVMFGASALFFSLAFLTTALAAFDLSDRSNALGLPEGSVRALIALLLITLFVITAIFLYKQSRFPVEGGMITYYKGMSKIEFEEAKIPAEEIIAIRVRKEEDGDNIVTIFDVDRKLPAVNVGEESERLAQQILTAISTLIAAVVAFYFGTRSVRAAQEAIAISQISQPVISGMNPLEGNQGDELTSVEIFGKHFRLPKKVMLVYKTGEEMHFDSVLSSASKITGNLKIEKKAPDGPWELFVVNEDGGEGSKPDAFTVKDPTSPDKTSEEEQPEKWLKLFKKHRR
jgi:hypothetical protein